MDAMVSLFCWKGSRLVGDCCCTTRDHKQDGRAISKKKMAGKDLVLNSYVRNISSVWRHDKDTKIWREVSEVLAGSRAPTIFRDDDDRATVDSADGHFYFYHGHFPTMRLISSFFLSILAVLPFLGQANSVAGGLVGVLLALNVASNAAAASTTSDETVAKATNDNDNDEDDENDEEYESKIQEAMQYFKSKSSQLLKQALQEGGGSVGDASILEINPNGDIVSSTDGTDNVEEELWQTEFALTAMEQELQRLQNRLKHDNDDEDDDEDEDEDEDEEEEEEEDSDDEDEYDYGDNFPPENYRLSPEAIDAQLQNDPELKAILDSITDPKVRNDKYGDIKSEADMAAKMDIDKWHTFKYWEMHAFFSCARQFTASRPVYDTNMWNEVRQLWNDFANEDKLDNFKPGMKERTYQFSTDSFDPPMEPFHAGEKGRGLRAARDIAKGELVFKATNNTVIFTHGHTWRKFLFHIYERHGEDGPFDGGTACDVLLWSWVQRIEKDGPLVIVADFDNGSLLNEGRDEPGWDKPNVRCGKEGDEMCMMEYYATDDIKTGEEILCDYRGFALLGAWRNMGV